MIWKNKWNVFTAKLRGWRERHSAESIKGTITHWGNALTLMSLSALLVANVVAMVLWAFKPAFDPWSLCSIALCVMTTAVVLKMLGR